ncbi:MAG TPA: putative baseplate assembly protein [Thermoanaerobaculia bacterium]
MIYLCCDDTRRDLLRASALNGIDFLEVSDELTDPIDDRQRTLFVHLMKNADPMNPIGVDNIRIDGGQRVRDIKVVKVEGGTGSPPSNVLVVEVASPGDFSRYTLRLVATASPTEPPPGFDVMLSSVDFSFKVACPSDFDCRRKIVCPPQPPTHLDINYLAKDYASFRQLILDRMATIAPHWRERSAADLGIAAVEILAYIGDYLSYKQDAVATEAYLHTARRRVSLRRHARLVDYTIGEGSNARAWVQVRVDAQHVQLPAKTRILTRLRDWPTTISPLDLETAVDEGPEVFETIDDADLYVSHNEIAFHTWGDDRCCLPRNAIRATLKNPNSALQLKAGDVLLLVEARNPDTGLIAEADPTHRHAVRLTKVEKAVDALLSEDVLNIEWGEEDALPFPLCIALVASGPEMGSAISVALGNIVLADHGYTVTEKIDPPVVPRAKRNLEIAGAENDFCAPPAPRPTPARYRPTLKKGPLTHTTPTANTSASAMMKTSAEDCLPAIKLTGDRSGTISHWKVRRDLLNSPATAEDFVVEMESDGTAFLRFGDDRFGRRPAEDTVFTATYRIGNGTAGNAGAGALAHIVTSAGGIREGGVTNLLPAKGGRDPETPEEIRQNTPVAFKSKQERAVTAPDYAQKAEESIDGVQRAAATLRWTGSWYTVFLTLDRLGGQPFGNDAKEQERRKEFQDKARQKLEKFRMAGHDLEIDEPRDVPLEIEIFICVKPEYFKSQVEKAVLEKFSAGTLPDGTRGIFHPDNLSFGQAIFLSPLYAAAQSVDGVASVEITKFQRQGIDSDEAIRTGRLELNRLEIARLDNDPNFPDRGVLKLNMGGGR